LTLSATLLRILAGVDEQMLAAQRAEGVREAGCAVDVSHNDSDANFMGGTEFY